MAQDDEVPRPWSSSPLFAQSQSGEQRPQCRISQSGRLRPCLRERSSSSSSTSTSGRSTSTPSTSISGKFSYGLSSEVVEVQLPLFTPDSGVWKSPTLGDWRKALFETLELAAKGVPSFRWVDILENDELVREERFYRSADSAGGFDFDHNEYRAIVVDAPTEQVLVEWWRAEVSWDRMGFGEMIRVVDEERCHFLFAQFWGDEGRRKNRRWWLRFLELCLNEDRSDHFEKYQLIRIQYSLELQENPKQVADATGDHTTAGDEEETTDQSDLLYAYRTITGTVVAKNLLLWLSTVGRRNHELVEEVGEFWTWIGSDWTLSALCAHVDPHCLRQLPKAMRGCKKFVLRLLPCVPGALQFVAKPLKNDFEVVLTALESRYWENTHPLLRHASLRLQNNPIIVKAAIERDSMSLRFASDELLADREVVMAAVRRDGAVNLGLLKDRGSPLFFDKEVVRAAYQSGYAHLVDRVAPEEFRRDPTVNPLAEEVL